MKQISANLVHRELRNATFEGKKIATSIKRPDSADDAFYSIKIDRKGFSAPLIAFFLGFQLALPISNSLQHCFHINYPSNYHITCKSSIIINLSSWTAYWHPAARLPDPRDEQAAAAAHGGERQLVVGRLRHRVLWGRRRHHTHVLSRGRTKAILWVTSSQQCSSQFLISENLKYTKWLLDIVTIRCCDKSLFMTILTNNYWSKSTEKCWDIVTNCLL